MKEEIKPEIPKGKVLISEEIIEYKFHPERIIFLIKRLFIKESIDESVISYVRGKYHG